MPKLAIMSPVEGTPETAMVHLGPRLQMERFKGALKLDEFWGVLTGNIDVVRARDRMARIGLFNTDATHFLWWDEDVDVQDIHVVERMMASGHQMVGCPYRRKKMREEYPYRLLGTDGERRDIEVVNGCIQVDHLAFGFMLTTRKCLQDMWDHYLESRWYVDVFYNQATATVEHHQTVSMFDLQMTATIPGVDGHPFRTKLSEDYSFCQSYQAIGGHVHMYVGDGSPVGHIGSTVFRGTREGLVNV